MWRIDVRRFFILSISVVVGCATPEPLSFSRDFVLSITDNPAMNRFDLQLRSGASRLCLSLDQWPDRFGRVEMSHPRATVTTDRGRYPARHSNFGYCRGESCTIRVPAGGQVSGFVAYSEFPPDAGLTSSSARSLEYVVHPYRC